MPTANEEGETSMNVKRRLERPPNDDALVAHYTNSLG